MELFSLTFLSVFRTTGRELVLHDLQNSRKYTVLKNEVNDAIGVVQVGTRLLIMHHIETLKMSWSLYQTLKVTTEWRVVLEDSGPYEIVDNPSDAASLTRKQSSFCCVGGKQVYMLGGLIGVREIKSRDCVMFNVETRKWSEVPPMK